MYTGKETTAMRAWSRVYWVALLCAWQLGSQLAKRE